MEILELKLESSKKALETLKEALNEPYSIYLRDATIQRFKYTFEALWKFLKEYLKVRKGIIVTSPKDCFREIFLAGFCDENETSELLKMTESINETSQAYNEEIANKIFSAIKTYKILIAKLLSNITIKQSVETTI